MASLRAPFRFCLQCGVSYGARQSSDFAKLTELSSGGRSTDTTILSMAVICRLRSDQNLIPKARKLLSFTDNRQDASLQAGHFNDFVEIALLRSALYRAVKANEQTGISHDVLTLRLLKLSACQLSTTPVILKFVLHSRLKLTGPYAKFWVTGCTVISSVDGALLP